MSIEQAKKALKALLVEGDGDRNNYIHESLASLGALERLLELRINPPAPAIKVFAPCDSCGKENIEKKGSKVWCQECKEKRRRAIREEARKEERKRLKEVG